MGGKRWELKQLYLGRMPPGILYALGAKSGKGIYSAATEHADGGIMSTPHLGLVAEDGPEAIIPLSGGRRRRGLDLWNKTGDILGAASNGGAATQAPASRNDVKIGPIQITVKVDGSGSPQDTVNEIALKLAPLLQQTWANIPLEAC